MNSTKYLKCGQVVRSKNGRDMGKVFLVNKIIDDNHVEIVDGKRRTLLKPKTKKIKHLVVYKRVFEEFETKDFGKYQLNDAYIRRILKPYSEIELDKKEVSIYE